MKPGDVYRTAAERIDAGYSCGWSCWAIEDVLGVPCHEPDALEDDKHELVVWYESIFKPFEKSEHAWGHEWDVEERKNCRVLALCLMAAIADSEPSRE